MDVFNSLQAGRHLGVTDRTIRNLINRGEVQALSVEPIRLDVGHVADVLRVRQAAALQDLARRRQTPVSLARDTRRHLLSREGFVLPDDRAEHQRRRLALLPEDAKSLFGTAALTAVLAESDCGWCTAQKFAATLEGLWAPTEFSPAFRALFDQDPCERCGPGLYGAVMASLASRVHPPGTRPPEPAPRPSEAERQAAREWAASRPVTASAAPMQADDGRALVSRRRREVQARLKAANRRGDSAYAESLARSLEALTADARVVDGRAAAPRGRKACGTPVGVRCECHTSDRRGKR
jgi:hypothetical protein